MVALRSPRWPEDSDAPDGALPRPNPNDWLPLQKAACELNVSVSTARRMIRNGRLRNRIVPRKGGFQYLVYLPNNRHSNGLSGDGCARPAEADPRAPRSLLDFMRTTRESAITKPLYSGDEREEEYAPPPRRPAPRLQPQLSGAGAADGQSGDPYARYRQLVRRKRFWPF